MTKKLTQFIRNHSKQIAITGFILLITLSLFAILWSNIYNFFSLFANTDELREFILGFGILSPLIVILITTLQVLIAPIPAQVTAFVSGYIFGVTWGTIYSLIGVTLGSFLAFIIGRKFGRKFVSKIVNSKIFNKFDNICDNRDTFILFLIFLLPCFPDDAICYLAGLSKIKIRTFVLISVIGRLPTFIILNMFGSNALLYNNWISYSAIGSFVLISFGVFWYEKKIENVMMKVIMLFKTKSVCDELEE